MSVVLILALALSAGQIEEIILEQYPDREVFQVIPTSHPAVEYEWRITPTRPGDLYREGQQARIVGLAEVGDRILQALGTADGSEWEWGGLFGSQVGRQNLGIEELQRLPLLMGKKANLSVSWGLNDDEDRFEARILVFDPEQIPLYSHRLDD